MSRIVHLAKTVLAWVVCSSGLLRLVQRCRRPHVVVLAYHRVTPETQMDGCAYPAMHVSTRSFDEQLTMLGKLYHVIPMAELREILGGRKKLERHSAVITFDDGYRDNYKHAFPILVRHGLPATFFLSYGFVDADARFWFDRLADVAKVWDADSKLCNELRDRLAAPVVAALDSSQPIHARLRQAAAYLKTLPDEDRCEIMKALDSVPSSASPAEAESMRWPEVRSMRDAGMTIASHGIQHAILTRMPPSAARAEMRQSMDAISARLGKDVTEFAYPNGDANDRIAELAREAGVHLGFTMEQRQVSPGDDPHRLGRRNVCEDTSRSAFSRFSGSFFACEIVGVFDFVLRRNHRRGPARA